MIWWWLGCATNVPVNTDGAVLTALDDGHFCPPNAITALSDELRFVAVMDDWRPLDDPQPWFSTLMARAGTVVYFDTSPPSAPCDGVFDDPSDEAMTPVRGEILIDTHDDAVDWVLRDALFVGPDGALPVPRWGRSGVAL